MNNEQEIIDNKKVAAFTGAFPEGTLFYYFPNLGKHIKPEDFQYNKSWDALIPVIELCRERQIFGSQRLISNIDERLLKLDLIATYRNTLDCITWYNAQKNMNNVQETNANKPINVKPPSKKLTLADFKEGDTVLCPDPDYAKYADSHSHSFVGHVEGFHGEYVTVIDGDGDCWDFEPERLKIEDDE